MAIYKIQAEKDATIYSSSPTQNTGLDEILELRASTAETSKIVIKFPSNQVTSVINMTDGNYKTVINLSLAEDSEVDTTYTISANSIPNEWEQGTGKFHDTPLTTNGVTWNTLDLPIGSVHQTINQNYDANLKLDVSTLTPANHGYILSLQNTNVELNTAIKYFSKETHTIYQPQLEIMWDDYEAIDNILAPTSDDLIINISNNIGTYRVDELLKFNLHIRNVFPDRVFQITSIYLNNKILSNILWGLKDMSNGQMVFDFDPDYTKVSSNIKNNYFKLFTSGLEPERYYQVMFKIVTDDFIRIYESSTFKIIK